MVPIPLPFVENPYLMAAKNPSMAALELITSGAKPSNPITLQAQILHAKGA
jgi:hypothetical protein